MRIDATRMMTIKPELMELLKNLEVGDTLKGRILEVLGSSIAIRTASGQIFNAVLQEGANVPKGAFIELIVNNIADGKIYAEIKTENKAADIDTTVSSLLKQVNLPVEDRNIEAVKLLIKYKLPIDREAIVNITGLQKSIESLNQSSEGRVALLLSGLDIKNTPVDVLNKLVLSWSSDMVLSDAEGSTPAPSLNTPALGITEGESTQETEQLVALKANQNTAEESSISEGKGNVKEPTDIIKTSNAETHSENINQKEPNKEAAAQNPSRGSDIAAEDNKGIELLKVLDKMGIETGSEVKSFAVQVENILASIKSTDMEALTYLVSKEMETTPKNIGLLIKNIENKDGISQFLDKLQQRLAIEDNPELNEIKDSIKKIFLEPRQVEDSKEVSEQLKDIARLGEKLESYLSNSGIKDPEIRDTLSSLKDNIDFVRSINEHNNFIQLPLLINGDTSTAKLYVFKEGKRSKAINPENATILIALDLKSLGHMESMIGVKGKTVSITFRVVNSGIGTILEKHSSLLKSSLNEKGYNLNPVKIINLEQPFSLLSLEEMMSESSLDKIHFDMRV